MWQPPKGKVGNHELIGRRLFSERKQLKGGTGAQKRPSYELFHFLDKRTPGEVSLDRLGENKINQQVLEHLTPQFKKHAEARKGVYGGWATAPAKDFAVDKKAYSLSLQPSPITQSESEDENDFHCNTEYKCKTDNVPDDEFIVELVGLKLKEVFDSYFDSLGVAAVVDKEPPVAEA